MVTYQISDGNATLRIVASIATSNRLAHNTPSITQRTDP